MCARVNFGSEWVAGHGVSKLGGFNFESWELCVIFLTFINFMYEQHCLFVDFAQADENISVIKCAAFVRQYHKYTLRLDCTGGVAERFMCFNPISFGNWVKNGRL